MRRRHKTHWWAVWLAEYPEEGSTHLLAIDEADAIGQAKDSPFFGEDDEGVMPELVACRVTAQQHREWLASGDAEDRGATS